MNDNDKKENSALISSTEDKSYSNTNAPLKGPLLQINRKHAHPQNNNVTILDYLFETNNKILDNLTVNIERKAILPNDEDDSCHNAFYYAIRTGNVDLLDKLINKWPGNYFAVHSRELDKIISLAYDELKLKNVPLLEEIEIFVEDVLINIRFFSDGSKQIQNAKEHFNNIRQRIELVLQNISLLIAEYSNDNTPLLIGKCLRNHLAHENTLVNALLSDPSKAIILNAKKLISKNITKSKKKLGKLINDVPSELKEKLDQSLRTITNQEKMFTALEKGNIKNFKKYLRKGADIKARSNMLWTTLHFAAKGPSLEAIKYIINQKFDVNLKDLNGQSPLHIAAAHGRKNTVEFFLTETGICVDDLDKKHRTPLHIAAEHNNKEVVEILLKNNASTNTKDKRGLSPLHYAIKHNHIIVAKILLEKETNVDVNEILGGFTPLHLAAERGHLQSVNFLLRNGANVNAKTDKEVIPLHLAALNGHLEVVNALILKGANVNSRNITGCIPLHYAIENGNRQIANILLEHGSNVNVVDNTYNDTPLHFAVNFGHEEIVKDLLKNKANTSIATVEGFTALHLASNLGHLKIVAALLQHGVEIHCKNKHYVTALHISAYSGHREIVELLIKNGAKIYDEDNEGLTPLHLAALKGNIDIIDLLIKNKADVNIRNNNGATPLQIAVANGQKVAAAFLIKNKAEVNATHKYGLTPLHTAVIKGNKEIVNLLIKNKAKVNAKSDHGTPLQLAMIIAHLEILKFLIAKGADINVVDNKMVKPAVLAGNKDIVETLLKTKPHINIKDPEYAELLHSAIIKGHTHLVKYFIKKGFDVNSNNFLNVTPLYIAAGIDQEEIAEILITNGANVNVVTEGGAPLHVATEHGHNNVVQILLRNGASIDIKDSKNRTPLELAVVHGYVQIVKMFLQFNKVNINGTTQDGLTLLHIASQEESNLNMVKFLVNIGCDVNAKNNKGSKPIHIAAREGNKDIVEFFLSKGLSINEYGSKNQTLLHYAAIEGHLEVIKYLIAQGANINAKDSDGITPMHIAANFGCKKDAIEILINNYGIYNAADNMLGLRPVDVAYNEDVKYLFTLIEKLFESVKCNDSSEVENSIRAGAYVNAKNADNATSLHYAAWKGYDKVVKILLQNKANPNAVGKNGFTPIHYATKFSHLKIVKILLYHGAVYNTLSDSGKIPLDFAVDEDIAGLFKLINKSFKQIMENNIKVIEDLNKIKDIDTVKTVMRACNRENETLIVAAIHNNFSEVGQLKQIWQNDVSIQHNAALALMKQKRVLGLNDIDTLKTRDLMALVLHRQGENEKAGNIYQEIYQKQNEILGPAHSDTLNTQLHMALVLDKQGKFQEALNINKTVFERRKETLGTHNLDTVKAKNNIAMVLLNQGKLEESLKIYKEVLEEKKCIIGINHSDTLRTLHSIAGVLFRQQKHNEALKTFQELLNIQEKVLPKDHPETLITEYSIAEVLFAQRKYITALKVYRHNFEKTKSVFGPYHQTVLVSRVRMESIKMELKLEDVEVSVLQDLQRDINIAASNGDLDTVQHLLKSGGNANDIDLDGRTPLHYAVSNGHINVLNILLKYGADMTQVTNKGNTPLHIATNRGCKEIVQILLERISRDKLNVFVNSKTTSSGTTSLHIAAKNCFLEIVKCLLKHGAAYNIKNKEGKMPINVSKDPEVVHFFEVIEEMFESTKKGNVEVLDKLKLMKQDEFLAVTNALNNHGRTLLQIAISTSDRNNLLLHINLNIFNKN
ncbi:serine/threonine-protein phosphatase 6 regulatory ankyrin repeat subunit A-like [Chrysoperla carnea]|uniref:serine/threonine-protein phosphatase 6 regulatory ankyrin repeat subunit A-like n=1 Tax=Chrysoperla carnea TaxID=189513 RepID=UPI001D06C740|nr:serine/threonine-protein phosphatase 6 regulatory ankyrin repeat subunit A-like [Chrysoperla carnea]